MITELLTTVAVSGGMSAFVVAAGSLVSAIRKDSSKPISKKIEGLKPLKDGTLPWTIYSSGDDEGFRCPKCCNRGKNRKQPPICECQEHYDAHFHFTCGDCKFKAILRTADDNEHPCYDQ